MNRFRSGIAILGLGLALFAGVTVDAWAGQAEGPTYRPMGLGGWATWPNWAGTSWNWVHGWPYTIDYDWPGYDADHPPAYVRGYKVTPTWIDAYTPRPVPFYLVPQAVPVVVTKAAPVVAGPIVSARSVATGTVGMHCATPVATCALRRTVSIGGPCSCKVTGGQAHGSVTP